ncbi:DUF4214 domain-containing protein [Dankookia sp. P2]|uniref:DUF4214 domain-containing protein n=1 Tax=Dankookia sp. P2 TaxID=3423955 RepID=UPI003D679DE0
MAAEDLVRLLYLGLLAREPDAEGNRHHVDALTSGRVDPLSLLRSFLASGEFLALQGRIDAENPKAG